MHSLGLPWWLFIQLPWCVDVQQQHPNFVRNPKPVTMPQRSPHSKVSYFEDRWRLYQRKKSSHLDSTLTCVFLGDGNLMQQMTWKYLEPEPWYSSLLMWSCWILNSWFGLRFPKKYLDGWCCFSPFPISHGFGPGRYPVWWRRRSTSTKSKSTG